MRVYFFISGLKQSGKTFVLTRLIENLSKEYPVMFGSMEFGEDLYDENVEQQQLDGSFDGNIDNIFTFDSIYDVGAIIAEIRLQHKLYGIKLVALDSMMRMTNNNPDLKTDERRISEMFSRLGKLSKELKIPIIVVVQSSKEDLKSSIISVKGSMNADHEAYVWFHLMKTNGKDNEDEMRTVIWNKNKDTHKHPKQHLMFVPETSDFYRVEIDEHGNACKPLDKYRRPKAKVIETAYETIPATTEEESDFSMPTF
ncbi:MAG: DnaB-like helicase C-terminal domain-containing protein [Sulfurimonas sp.]|nr:DnaB-like helicase C-terminal domain-containing protein [Sulfurimonas sp.]